MKKLILLCLLFLTGMFMSCTRDHQPSIPAEEERHHITETEYDEEFWQKLQTDSLFIELREIVDYRNHSLKKAIF